MVQFRNFDCEKPTNNLVYIASLHIYLVLLRLCALSLSSFCLET